MAVAAAGDGKTDSPPSLLCGPCLRFGAWWRAIALEQFLMHSDQERLDTQQAAIGDECASDQNRGKAAKAGNGDPQDGIATKIRCKHGDHRQGDGRCETHHAVSHVHDRFALPWELLAKFPLQFLHFLESGAVHFDILPPRIIRPVRASRRVGRRKRFDHDAGCSFTFAPGWQRPA